MTAGELYRRAIAELARGAEAAAAERLKLHAADEAGRIEEEIGSRMSASAPRSDTGLHALLGALDERNQRFLALALPLVEYGTPVAAETVARSVRFFARTCLAPRPGGEVYRQGAMTVLGRLVWAIAAYSVECNRLDALVRLARIDVALEPDEPETPLLARGELRVFAGAEEDRDAAYRHYLDWLRTSDLARNEVPLFWPNVHRAMAEADLWLALRTAAVTATEVYSAGMSAPAVLRLRRRLEDASAVSELARLLGVSESRAVAELAEQSARIAYDHDRLAEVPSLVAG
ncbi:MAG: hypothetical protein M3321_08975 [Actinomycetota bacterium]|nr:hypothetical protein [Actinomycetota bacterium]